MSWRYDEDTLFQSGRTREVDYYRRLLQWYSFSVLSRRVVHPSDLDYIRDNSKEKQFPIYGLDFPLDQVLLETLDIYPLLSVLATTFYLQSGLVFPLAVIMVHFAGLVDREPVDVRPDISKRL